VVGVVVGAVAVFAVGVQKMSIVIFERWVGAWPGPWAFLGPLSQSVSGARAWSRSGPWSVSWPWSEPWSLAWAWSLTWAWSSSSSGLVPRAWSRSGAWNHSWAWSGE
jgi:hypothetical protein